MALEFSDTNSHNFSVFSPDGLMIASAYRQRLVVRKCDTLEQVIVFPCQDHIQKIEWSPDSKLVLCGCFKRSLVSVVLISDPEWKCRIHDPLASIVNAYWAPDSRHIITVADFQLRLTVWSLISRSGQYIPFPKYSNQGVAFSPDGSMLAVLRREDSKDFLRVFSINSTFEHLFERQLDSSDAADITFTTSGDAIIYWDTELGYALSVIALNGKKIYAVKNEEPGLGIKKVVQKANWIGIGSYSERLVLLNADTWQPVVSFPHYSPISDESVSIFEEVYAVPEGVAAEKSLHSASVERTFFLVQPTPYSLPAVPPDPSKPNPKLGVGSIEFSQDCTFVATRNDNMPNCLWIWSVDLLKLVSVLVFKSSVRCFRWSPLFNRLAVVTGTFNLFFWDGEGASAVNIPVAALHPTTLSFSPDGDSILLADSDKFCLCYLDKEAEEL
ncbi:hypothetical protein RCL1_008836 [Eukaryota sp. TZLM3-RCL]